MERRRGRDRLPTPGVCAAPGCDNVIHRDRLMCPGHWRRVPGPLRDAVRTTYRAYLHDDAPLGPYMDAVEAAQAAADGWVRR